MDKRLRMALLYDLYGDLLTDKQRDYVALYYLEDLSLSEIGERQGVTPQAAKDMLHRVEVILERFEAKLLLVENYMRQQKARQALNQALWQMETSAQGLTPAIDEVKRIIDELLTT